MPQLTRWVTSSSIAVDRLERAFTAFRSHCDDDVPERRSLRVHRSNERWDFEELDDFLNELRRHHGAAELVEEHHDCSFRVEPEGRGAALTLRMPSTAAIDEVLLAFGVEHPGGGDDDFTVFLGHGRNLQWRALADHLRTRHGFDVVTYETSARVGQPAMDVLAELAADVSFAILLHTAEVIGDGNTFHAGANVIHETGYFQARLGPSRALIVREENCHPFANVAGLTELKFRTGGVQEIFGDVVAILREVERAR
jgi:hypothetical protein